MPYSTNIIKLLDKLEPATKEVLIAILEEIEVQREATVTKKEFNELKEIVKQLAINIEKLTQAQNKFEERLSKLAEKTAEIEQAIKRAGTGSKENRRRTCKTCPRTP